MSMDRKSQPTIAETVTYRTNKELTSIGIWTRCLPKRNEQKKTHYIEISNGFFLRKKEKQTNGM